MIKVGTMLKDLNGKFLKVISINGILYTLKYVNENGTLSNGSVIAVASHLKMYEIVD